jgi:uncharacterized protein (UPF0147 family)
MSSPAETGPSDKRKNVIGKYVKRMSTVFKREKSSKNVPTLASDATSALQTEQQQPTEREGAKMAVIPAR